MRSVKRLCGLLLCTSVGLAGCGGGDSTLDLGGARPGNEARVNGLVAVGAPVAGAQVTITCAAGVPINGTADINGAFSFSADKQMLPCAVRASGGAVGGVANTSDLHSVFYAFGRVNVTPLTDLLVARLTSEEPSTYHDGFTSGGRASRVSADAVAAASIELRQYLAALGVEAGSLDGFNLVTGPFSPNPSDAHDRVLEALAARLAANAMTLASARQALISFTLPGPCSDATSFCWPMMSYKLLKEGRTNKNGEPEAKFHETDVDVAIHSDGSWTKSLILKDSVNHDIDVGARGLRFTSKYQASSPGQCNYAVPANETCYEALHAAMVMVCGPGAGDDFVLMPFATVAKGSTAEVTKDGKDGKVAASALHGLAFDRIVGCTKASNDFVIGAEGQVSDGSDATVMGVISNHLGKDWSAKNVGADSNLTRRAD